MRGTTWVQIVKAVLLMSGTVVITFLVLLKFDFNLSKLLGEAAAHTGKGEAFLQPGLLYGKDLTGQIDFLSLGLALVLGTAGLPHILIRFYTVPDSKAARRSVQWAIGLIGTFYLMTLALGFGAAALLDTGEDSQVATSKGNVASPLLAESVGGGAGSIGGAILLALIAAVAFATILAVVAGLTLTSASSFAHDLYANVFAKGKVTERQELRVARYAAAGIGAVAIALAIPAQNLNIAFLVALAFAVAASANLPALLYNLFWKRFNTAGAVWSIYGGLVTAVVLVFFSPVVSGTTTAMFPDSDWHWFPLANPGIISIPAGFLFGIVGTLLRKDPDSIDAVHRARGPRLHRRRRRRRRPSTDTPLRPKDLASWRKVLRTQAAAVDAGEAVEEVCRPRLRDRVVADDLHGGHHGEQHAGGEELLGLLGGGAGQLADQGVDPAEAAPGRLADRGLAAGGEAVQQHDQQVALGEQRRSRPRPGSPGPAAAARPRGTSARSGRRPARASPGTAAAWCRTAGSHRAATPRRAGRSRLSWCRRIRSRRTR